MSVPRKIARINFDEIDQTQISRILKDGNVNSLSPEERDYYDLMELTRGWIARMTLPGGNKVVTKAGIIKVLKSDLYGLSDWMARRVYSDTLNFFYGSDDVTPRAWANLYADRMDKLAVLAATTGQLKVALAIYDKAAKLRGCYDIKSAEIPRELLDAAPVVVYDTDPAAMGAPKADRRELEAFIDSLPAIPEVSRRRVKEDAGIIRGNILERMAEDIKEFSDEEE